MADSLSQAYLAKRGVTLVDRWRLIFECNECGQVWMSNLRTGGRLAWRFWQCPNGCNVAE